MSLGATLSMRDLVKFYAGSGAVRGVSLELEQGKFLTLLGPSGSGKTTTLMMIAGFVEPSSGDIVVNGKSVVRLPAHKRDMGMVFQNYALFPHMTVAENIAFPLKMRRVDAATANRRAAEALELWNAWKLKKA